MRSFFLCSICTVLVLCSACSLKNPPQERALSLKHYGQGEMDKGTERGIKKAIRNYLAGDKPADIEEFCVENKVGGDELNYPMVWIDEIIPMWDIGETWTVGFSGMTKEEPKKFLFWAGRNGEINLTIDLEGIDGEYRVANAFLAPSASSADYVGAEDWEDESLIRD